VAAPRNAGDPATGWQAWSLAPVRDTTDLAPGAEAEADARLPAFSQPARGRHAADRDRERPSLRIGVLGALTVNGAAASPPPGQAHLLLVLALSGQDGLSNQQLCYLLGADPDHPRSTDSLRQLIAAARRQLGRTADGREWIEHLGAGRYALHPESRFDWRDFEELAAEGMRSGDAERLRGALWLIRGEPLADCYLWSLDPAQLEIMRAQIVDAAQMLSGMELDEGNCAAAAGAARAGLAGDAGAEQLWRALMRAEHAAGNLVGVREAWNQCLDQIAEIVADGEPHPQTAALYRELAESTVQPAG
jgi:DNA-binding SARP family transcriptional activator